MKNRNVKTASAALAVTHKPAPAVSFGDGLENVVAGLGTERDKRSFTSWALPRFLSRIELENMYRGSWLSGKIVDAPAEDMSREWFRVVYGDDDDEADDAKKNIELVEKQFSIKEKVTDVRKWARLYGGAMLVVGTNDTKDMSKPLDVSKLGKDCIRFIQVLDRWRVAPSGEMTRDLDDPNFGLPESYVVAESTVKIHHSRCILFHGRKLPYFAWMQNGMWHDSILQRVVESLLNTEGANQSVASMLYEANVDVVTSKGLTQQVSTKEGTAKVTKRYQLAGTMKSFNKLLLLDGDETFEKKSNAFSGLDSIMEEFRIETCGAADMPMMRLFGQSAQGLGEGDNDIRNYYDMLSSNQEMERPQLERLYEIVCRHATGSIPDDYRIEQNPLWQVSTTEQATIDKTNADRDKIYLDAGVIDEGLVARELKKRGTYHAMTDADVELAEELANEPDAPPIDPLTGLPAVVPEAGPFGKKIAAPVGKAGKNPSIQQKPGGEKPIMKKE